MFWLPRTLVSSILASICSQVEERTRLCLYVGRLSKRSQSCWHREKSIRRRRKISLAKSPLFLAFLVSLSLRVVSSPMLTSFSLLHLQAWVRFFFLSLIRFVFLNRVTVFACSGSSLRCCKFGRENHARRGDVGRKLGWRKGSVVLTYFCRYSYVIGKPLFGVSLLIAIA